MKRFVSLLLLFVMVIFMFSVSVFATETEVIHGEEDEVPVFDCGLILNDNLVMKLPISDEDYDLLNFNFTVDNDESIYDLKNPFEVYQEKNNVTLSSVVQDLTIWPIYNRSLIFSVSHSEDLVLAEKGDNLTFYVSNFQPQAYLVGPNGSKKVDFGTLLNSFEFNVLINGNLYYTGKSDEIFTWQSTYGLIGFNVDFNKIGFPKEDVYRLDVVLNLSSDEFDTSLNSILSDYISSTSNDQRVRVYMRLKPYSSFDSGAEGEEGGEQPSEPTEPSDPSEPDEPTDPSEPGDSESVIVDFPTQIFEGIYTQLSVTNILLASLLVYLFIHYAIRKGW